MRKLAVFDQVSLDGFFTTPNGDISWLHQGNNDPEWQSFVESNAGGGGVLLFGRVTYEMMVSYWPTPAAAQQNPVVAERMNSGQKVVFSRTLKEATWQNTKVARGDLATEVRALKAENGPDLVVLGSGSLVAQLTELGLVDEYQIVVFPIVLGEGRTLFEGVKRKVPLTRTASRTFGNGNVLLTYQPAR
jgi:dihydrofolate reductase